MTQGSTFTIKKTRWWRPYKKRRAKVINQDSDIGKARLPEKADGHSGAVEQSLQSIVFMNTTSLHMESCPNHVSKIQ